MKNRKTQLGQAFFAICWLLAGSLALSSCASMFPGMGGATPGGDIEFPPEENYGSAPVSFTILQLNDVYEIAPLDKGRVGGMARVATLREQLLGENYNTLTVLAGDFLSPSLIGTLKHEGKRIRGRQMVEVMNALGVNLAAFGNHEFDVKEEELQERLNESYFEWLGTNVLHKRGDRLEPFHKMSYDYKYFVPETYVWEVTDYEGGTVRVGFYSATINSNQQPWVHYEDPYSEATKAYLELTGKADVIIGLTHLDLAADLKLASLLPKTALIMGGHEHENSLDSVGSVVITKADANAKSAYVHRFTWYPETKTFDLASQLVPVTDEMESNFLVDSLVQHWQGILHEQLSQIVDNPEQVIFNAKEPLDGREVTVRNQQSNLGGLIAAGMAYAAKKPVDCAFFNGGSIRLDDQLEGDITAVDIFRALPYGGSLYEIEIKGSLLKKVLNAGLESKGLGGYQQWWNIEHDEKSKTWKVAGKPLSEGKTYRAVASDYGISGKEPKFEFFTTSNKDVLKWETGKESDPADLRTDVRKAVIAYLKNLPK